MFNARRYVLPVALGIAWLAAVSWGAGSLWRYESAPGAAADAPARWPAQTRAIRQAGLPALVLLIHPQCPCTAATIDELSRLMTDCQGKVTATVLVLHPRGMPAGWEKTSLWTDAAAIKGVTVLTDEDGIEARSFGAVTSGQALLYSAQGRLLFSGGITESRGHSGDNAGRSAIESLVMNGSEGLRTPASTPVYGCPLCRGSKWGLDKGDASCLK